MLEATRRKDLSILIVTYNSRHLIDRLLTQLRDELAQLDGEVVVVDNASDDGTADQIEDHHPEVRLIRSAVNLGFAAGNNLAAQHARGHVLLLLNPDAMPALGTIDRGLTVMKSDEQIGLAGGRLYADDGSSQPSARMFPSLLQEALVISGLAARFPGSRWFGHLDRTWADPAIPAEVDWIPGAFALLRRDVFDALGGFDERFFLYYEEVDLCRRIRRAGYRVQYWPTLETRHIGGASARTIGGETVSRSGSQLTLWRARSGLLYYRKNHGWLTAWSVNRLERAWHRLRGWRAHLLGEAQKSIESAHHRALLAQAWSDTLGGRVAPPRPW